MEATWCDGELRRERHGDASMLLPLPLDMAARRRADRRVTIYYWAGRRVRRTVIAEGRAAGAAAGSAPRRRWRGLHLDRVRPRATALVTGVVQHGGGDVATRLAGRGRRARPVCALHLARAWSPSAPTRRGGDLCGKTEWIGVLSAHGYSMRRRRKSATIGDRPSDVHVAGLSDSAVFSALPRRWQMKRRDRAAPSDDRSAADWRPPARAPCGDSERSIPSMRCRSRRWRPAVATVEGTLMRLFAVHGGRGSSWIRTRRCGRRGRYRHRRLYLNVPHRRHTAARRSSRRPAIAAP